ncbi:MAG: DUF4091 domain-containing protein [Thermoguttaceae bacterium]|nr:DUF4091 domain-containing protein [Thermoguttaceae bacterium]
MRKRVAQCSSLLLFCVASVVLGTAHGADPAEFASKLCRDGGGEWTRVVPIVVENPTTKDYVERVVSVPIVGTKDAAEENAIPFGDEPAQSLRVCDSNGVEVLFNVTSPDGSFVDKGPIPEKSRLSFPVNAPAGGSVEYYVFAGNEKAFPNPDRLSEFCKSPTNMGFDSGAGDVPPGWLFDGMDDGHKLVWTEEGSFSGAKCVRCEVAEGQEPTWVAARQLGIALEPNAKYRFEGYVRGRNVHGGCGWYLHLGNRDNRMISMPMANAPQTPDFDWTRVAVDFTTSDKIDLVDFGTVLHGTGTAWFDAASLVRVNDDGTIAESVEPRASSGVRVGDEIALEVPASVYPSGNLDDRPARRRATIRVDGGEGGERLVMLDLSAFTTRWGRSITADDITIYDLHYRRVAPQTFGDMAFFTVDLVPNARNYLYIYENGVSRPRDVKTNRSGAVANQAFPGTMMQETNAENAKEPDEDALTSNSLALPEILRERNLLSDGDFENVDPATLREDPVGSDGLVWTRDADEPGVSYSIVDPRVSSLGKRALKIDVAEDAPRQWRGWRRRVSVAPNQTYLIGYAIATDSTAGQYDLHMHWRKKDGSLAGAGMSSLAKPTSGKTDWTIKSSLATASSDSDFVELHLTNQTYGVSMYDSVFVVPVVGATPVEFSGGQSGVFQVPAVAKVFSDTTFANDAAPVAAENPASCALALNEEETLQIAVRIASGTTLAGEYSVEARRPVLRGSEETLGAPEVFAVSNVLVDYPTNYYQAQGAATTRKFPTGNPSCDGWIGMWPDPLIPIETVNPTQDASDSAAEKLGDSALWNDSQKVCVDGLRGVLTLRENETRALWLRFRTTTATKPGKYEGVLTLTRGDHKFEVPYTVDVLGFVAPPTKITGIYDARISHDYFGKGSRAEKLERVAERLLDRKLCSDKPNVEPTILYDKATGQATADWTEFDAVATRYFDELGAKAAYFPGMFYLFGWGNPPKEIDGETPYPGEWPYDGADRAQLRPEYKKAYQAKLRLFWNHLKEKGWADKCVLYISDEPFYSKPEIISQMKALCDMIHEVDPAIPIYSSAWVFVPEWLRYLDVWGVGHYGGVSEESLRTIRDAGGRIWWTTDGQMCLDTPLCAVERLLPYTCVKHGAELYEFWGASWYTCNPFDSASHLYISQSDQPGVRYYVRYPNGDGYIFYPGEPIGRDGELVDSIRSEQAREGIEDAGWLVGLQTAIAEKTVEGSPDRARAQKVLDRALDYLPLSCGSGRYSTRYIADPEEFEQIRLDVGLELEALSKR